MLMLPCQMSPGQSIFNQSEERGGDEGDRGGDKGVAEIVAKEEAVMVLEIVTGEEEIMAEIVEEAEQAEEAEILREETTEEVVVETVTKEGWRVWRRRRRSWR